MKVTPIKTAKVHSHDDLIKILDKFIVTFKEKQVLTVTSKIVALCEGRVIHSKRIERDKLVEQEADLYLPQIHSKYGICFSIKNNTLIASAGIDQSNIDADFVLWPGDAQATANLIRAYLCKRFAIKHAGVIIADSTCSPLRWGTYGIAIAHSGFMANNDYVGKKDIYGRTFKVSRSNVAGGLAAAAVLVMGEGSEQTPLAIIEDVPSVQFQARNPNHRELAQVNVPLEDDLFAPFFEAVQWKEGRPQKQ